MKNTGILCAEETSFWSSNAACNTDQNIGRNLHGDNIIHTWNTIHGSVLWFTVHYVLPQRYLFAAIGNGFRLYDVLAHEGNVTAFYDVSSCLATFLFTLQMDTGTPSHWHPILMLTKKQSLAWNSWKTGTCTVQYSAALPIRVWIIREAWGGEIAAAFYVNLKEYSICLLISILTNASDALYSTLNQPMDVANGHTYHCSASYDSL